jgi:hypothetical protein
VYLATALSTQLFVFGSGGLPGVSARVWHLRRPVAFFVAHFVFPAMHLPCCADAGAAATSVAAISSAVANEDVFDIGCFPPRRWTMETRGNTR